MKIPKQYYFLLKFCPAVKAIFDFQSTQNKWQFCNKTIQWLYWPGWHVPIMTSVSTMESVPSLYGDGETDLIMKTWCNLTKSVENENEVKVNWHMHGWHVSTKINVWTKHGKPKFFGNEENDLITKTWHCYRHRCIKKNNI
jgi:hypothetical protein